MSRRSIVRAGAAAAWSAPLVLVLTAAPATAVGSGVANMTISMTATRVTTAVTTTGTVTNTGGQTTVNLQVTVTLTAGGNPGWDNTTTTTAPANWTASAGTNSGLLGVAFTYTRTSQLAANGIDNAFTPSFTLNRNKAGTLVGSATTTGGGSGGTGTVTVA